MTIVIDFLIIRPYKVIPLYFPNRATIFDKTIMDNWYYTPGGIGSGVPSVWNKHLYVTGEKTGLKIRGSNQ